MTNIEDVTRLELRRIDKRAEDDADLAERLVAAIYDVRHDPNQADCFDTLDTETGTR